MNDLKPNRTYSGQIAGGACMITSRAKGTLGFQMTIETEDGDIDYTMWLTPGTRDNAIKTFTEVLGVKYSNLQNASYVENQLALDVAGVEVEFDTDENEFNGKTKTVVKWLNRPSADGGDDPVAAAVAFFGGKVKPAQDFPVKVTADDSDIPFRFNPVLRYSPWHENMQTVPRIQARKSVLCASRDGRRSLEFLHGVH